jgi:1,4-alpha-glucan branching enzyme
MRLLLACLFCLTGLTSFSQLLTWTPPFPVENDASQTLVITLDATKGNQGLLNHTPTTDVYVHIGVITSASSSSSDWKYVKTTWGTTDAAARATNIAANRWQFTIQGSLRTYFGITNASETIQKIAILFRSGSGARVQRNADGSDMYIPIYSNNLAVRITLPATQPQYIPTPEPQNWTLGSSLTLAANSNRNGNLRLYHNGNLVGSADNTTTVTGSSTVSVAGNQQIIATVTEGALTRSDTLNIFVAPSGSPVAALPAGVRDGINYEAGNTSVTLVLRAPGKNFVTVIGDFNNWTQGLEYIMNKTPDGKFFWLRITGLTAGVEYGYQYKIDDSLTIADPYTQKVLDPGNDQFISSATFPNLKPYPSGQSGIVSVLQIAAPSYNWAVNNFTRPDKRGLIIYELLLRDFLAAHDWRTLSDTLQYLKRLGVNAIELLPFNEFEGNISWGYNPSFYFAPDKYYGPPNTLKQFIDSAHRNGIAVIMDIALNHSFGQSPMVQMYWDRQNQRPAANNPWYNPTPRHAFNVGFDMNHESLDTRYFTSRVVEHWLQEYKIDGFRFDLSKGFTQVNTCDANGNNCNVGQWGNYDASRVAIWKRYYDTLQLKSNGSYVILEHFGDNNEEKELADYGMLFWGNLNHQYSEASMGYLANSNFSSGIHSVRGWSKPHLITYMESHDEERITYKNINFGNSSGSYNIRDTATALKRTELAGAFLFTIPGPKMIWQFGELGYDYPINYCPNGTVNNNCRTDPKPIRWDYLAQQRRKNIYDVWSKIINLRFHPWYKEAFLSGTIDQNLGGAVKWLRVNSGDTSRLVVVGNFDVTAQTATVNFPTEGTWYEFLKNETYSVSTAQQSFTLQPGEYRMYINRNVNNLTPTPVINIPVTGTTLEAKVFPNPIQQKFIIEMYLPQTGNTSFDLLNSLGQKISSLQNGLLPQGKQQLNFFRPDINAGVYYIRLTTKSATKILPVTFQ